jgi:hypothetical protein
MRQLRPWISVIDLGIICGKKVMGSNTLPDEDCVILVHSQICASSALKSLLQGKFVVRDGQRSMGGWGRISFDITLFSKIFAYGPILRPTKRRTYIQTLWYLPKGRETYVTAIFGNGLTLGHSHCVSQSVPETSLGRIRLACTLN